MNNDNNEYINKNYQDYSDNNNYEEKPKYENIWWKIGGGILILLLIIVTIVTVSKRGKGSEIRYEELKSKLCTAAEEYAANNPKFIDNSVPGITKTIKIEKLADANLVETLIENPYYNENKKSEPRYYSLDNSVRLMTLTNGKFYCEMVDTSKDVTSPELRLSGDSVITIVVGTEYEDPGYTATDDYDGDITANVARSGNVKIDTAGEYKITYTVSDSAGNVTTKTRKIIVKKLSDADFSLGQISDNTVPMISLKGPNPYCIIKGTKYVEPGAVANDNVDGNITNRIVTKNEVTGNVLGAFRITYSVEDSSGNEAIVYRAVSVSSICPETNNDELIANTTPVITLAGQTSIVIEKGSKYIDLGATAYDKEDGDLTNKITTDTTLINTNVSGIYKVYYRITDSKGIVANAVRIVIVKGLNEPDTSIMFTTEKSNVSVLVGKGNDNLISPPKAINQEGYQINVTKKIEDYFTKNEVSQIDWNKTGKYRVIYTADNNSIVQTKTIIVTVMEGTIEIGGLSQISLTKRNDNCGVTQEDLSKGGVTFDTINNQLPVISIDYGSASVCKVGSYDVKVTATTTDNKEYSKNIKVNVVDGANVINTSAPSKVDVTYNSAFNTDKYNLNKKWVGGVVSGITINFSSTTSSGTSIAYYQYSDNCNEVIGNANKTSSNEGTLTWTELGANSICIRAVTTNGILGAWSNPINLYIDKTGPKTTFTHGWASGYNDWYNTPNLTIKYTATDPESGLDHFEYTYDDVMGLYGEKITNPQKFSEASGSLTVNETTQSSKPRLFVYVRAVDKAGNPGEWTANPAFANIDTLKPNAPLLSIIDNSTPLVKVKAVVTDAIPTNINALRISGFGKLIYKLDEGQEIVENTDTISLQSLTNIKQKISVWAVDKAGNRSDTFSQTEVTILPPKLLAKSVIMANNNIYIKDGGPCSTTSVYVGSTFKLTGTPEPLNADEKVVTWGTNNPSVATVDYDGTVKIVSKGTATIKAKIGSVSTTCIIDASYISTASSFTAKNYSGMNYYLYLPENLKANMPIIVFFHGSGESGTNVELVKKWGLPKAISEGTNYNAIIIAPQCTSGNRWFTGSIQEKVLAIINKTISDYSANPNKVSVTGFSIGGTGVYSIIENHHGVFASGVPVSAATEAVATSRFPDVPVWIFAGSKEGTLSSYATSIYNSFKKWKGTENYHLNIISGKDHTGMVGANGYNIYTDPTYNIVDWMISQTKK